MSSYTRESTLLDQYTQDFQTMHIIPVRKSVMLMPTNQRAGSKLHYRLRRRASVKIVFTPLYMT